MPADNKTVLATSANSSGNELKISLIVIGTVVGILLVALVAVFAYYKMQNRRLAAPKKEAPTVGYRTTINREKLKSNAVGKLNGVDTMKEPVNWSNAAPLQDAQQTQQQQQQQRQQRQINRQVCRRWRSLEAVAAIDIEADIPWRRSLSQKQSSSVSGQFEHDKTVPETCSQSWFAE